MSVIKFPMMVGAQCHRITQCVYLGDAIRRQEVIDGSDVTYFEMRFVTANGARFGPRRLAICDPCQTTNLSRVLLTGFSFEFVQRHRLPVYNAGVAGVAGGAPGVPCYSTMFAATGNALAAGKEPTIYAVGTRTGAVLRVGRFGATVQAVIHASSYWILLANSPLLLEQTPAPVAPHCGSCSSLGVAFWSSVHTLPSGCSDATLRIWASNGLMETARSWKREGARLYMVYPNLETAVIRPCAGTSLATGSRSRRRCWRSRTW